MTKLSIFLWLADSVHGLTTLFVLAGGVSIIALIILFAVSVDDDTDVDIHDFKWCFILGIPMAIFCLLIATFIPSKKTLYMIAGVEMANSIMETEDFKKAKSYLGETGIQMLDDIKSIIHKEAMDAIQSKTETSEEK